MIKVMDRESPLAVVARHQKMPPVDLDSIARELGVAVRKSSLGSNIAGMLVRDGASPSGFSIFINASENPNRQRFTYAHELAHFILHRDLIEGGLTDDTMYRSSLSNFYEVQANRMAADILMPVRLVKHHRTKLPQTIALAKLFGVSQQAMQIRLDSIDRGALNKPHSLFE